MVKNTPLLFVNNCDVKLYKSNDSWWVFFNGGPASKQKRIELIELTMQCHRRNSRYWLVEVRRNEILKPSRHGWHNRVSLEIIRFYRYHYICGSGETVSRETFLSWYIIQNLQNYYGTPHKCIEQVTNILTTTIRLWRLQQNASSLIRVYSPVTQCWRFIKLTLFI